REIPHGRPPETLVRHGASHPFQVGRTWAPGPVYPFRTAPGSGSFPIPPTSSGVPDATLGSFATVTVRGDTDGTGMCRGREPRLEAEGRLAFVQERRHAFALVGRAEQGQKRFALRADSRATGCLDRRLDRRLCGRQREAGTARNRFRIFERRADHL